MIYEAINKKPFIHFGLNQQEITINVGETATIWNDTILNKAVTAIGLQRINNNEFEFLATETGTFNISVKNGNVASNTIKINVI